MTEWKSYRLEEGKGLRVGGLDLRTRAQDNKKGGMFDRNLARKKLSMKKSGVPKGVILGILLCGVT